MDQKMTRVDISLIVRDKSARIKKGRCVYIIASQDFPKGPGNPISGREEAEDTTPHRLVMLGLIAAPEKNTQTVPDHNPYNLPISCKWS